MIISFHLPREYYGELPRVLLVAELVVQERRLFLVLESVYLEKVGYWVVEMIEVLEKTQWTSLFAQPILKRGLCVIQKDFRLGVHLALPLSALAEAHPASSQGGEDAVSHLFLVYPVSLKHD